MFSFEPIDPELERGFDARASVASFDAEYANYVAASAAAKAAHPPIPDLVFDETSGERLDLYCSHPGGPLFLWIHGGYWRASSKDDNAFVVLGLVPHGVNVAVVDYTLAPAATLDEIVRQLRTSIAWLQANAGRYGYDGRRIHVGGSSAGGHLVGMLLAGGWRRSFGLREDCIGTALALSGLMDLEPLRFTPVNAWMRLDRATARRNSPLFLIPERSDARLIVSVGGLETLKFRQQTTEYAAAWARAGHSVEVIEMQAYNHFDIALSLSDPAGLLARAVVASMARQAQIQT